MPDAPFLFRWRNALLSERGPPAMRRHVLNVLSGYGDEHGADIYPSTRELARATGLGGRRHVVSHLQAAEEEGWIRRHESGSDRGKGWKRHRYELLIPDHVVPQGVQEEGKVVPQGVQEEDEGGPPPAHGGPPPSPIVVPQGVQTSPYTSPETSPSPSGADADGEQLAKEKKPKQPTWVQRCGRVWWGHMGGTPPWGAIGSHLKPFVTEHGADEVVRRLDVYLAHHVENGEAKFASPAKLAQTFGTWGNSQPRKRGGYQDPAAGIDYDALAAENEQ